MLLLMAQSGIGILYAIHAGGTSSSWSRALGRGALGGGVTFLLLGIGPVSGLMALLGSAVFLLIGPVILLGMVAGALCAAAGQVLRRRAGPSALRIAMGVVLTAIVVLFFLHNVVPYRGIDVPWPDRGVAVRIEMRGLRATWPHVVVTSPDGSTSALLQGPEAMQRANIYRKPNGYLTVLVEGGARTIEISPGLPPRLKMSSEPDRGGAWTYIGAVLSSDHRMSFESPKTMSECAFRGIAFVPARSGADGSALPPC